MENRYIGYVVLGDGAVKTFIIEADHMSIGHGCINFMKENKDRTPSQIAVYPANLTVVKEIIKIED